jgi:hypothetical protein
MKNVGSFQFWFAEKTLGVVTSAINSERRLTQCEKMSSIVRSVNVFCGLEKYDYLALDKISLWGATTFDVGCFRGVTILALTTLVQAQGSCH